MKNEPLEFAMLLQSNVQPCYADAFSTAKVVEHHVNTAEQKMNSEIAN